MDRDDEFLSDDTFVPQVPEYTPIMSGFVYCCEMWRRRWKLVFITDPIVSAQLLERRKMQNIQPLSGERLTAQIREMDDMMYCIEHLFDRCPEDLRLDPAPTPAPTAEDDFFRLLQLVNEAPPTSLAPIATVPTVAKASYQAQQANLYVTQVSIRVI